MTLIHTYNAIDLKVIPEKLKRKKEKNNTKGRSRLAPKV